MKRILVWVTICSAAIGAGVGIGQGDDKSKKTGAAAKKSADTKISQRQVVSDLKVHPELLDAFNKVVEIESEGDPVLKTRLQLSIAKAISDARHYKRDQLLKQRAELQAALDRNAAQLGLKPALDKPKPAISRSTTNSIKPIPDNLQNALHGVPSKRFAPRFMFPTVTTSDLFANAEWRKNIERGICEHGCAFQPRIFNPFDDENNPTLDLEDCVAVMAGRSPCCTGTLIASNAVLTAAHCVVATDQAPCGATHIYIGPDATTAQPHQLFKIKEKIYHKDFNRRTFENDVAILILEEHINHVPIREFAYPEELEAAPTFLAVGFGVTDEGTVGRKFEVRVAKADLAERIVVAGGGGFDSCFGDSGGPIYYEATTQKYKGQLFLAGITSYGLTNDCGAGGVYMRADHYKEWVDRVLAEFK